MPVISFSFTPLSSNFSINPFSMCFITETNIYMLTAFSITNLLLLPVFIFILYLGFQQWRKQHSTSTASASHSDIFTYHCVAMQLNERLGFLLFLCGSFVNLVNITLMGLYVGSATTLGKALFHILTCVERYLAVVHPVTYLGLKQAGGVKIRNISIGCVWFITVGSLLVVMLSPPHVIPIFNFCTLTSVVFPMFFCSIAVLCALRHPGPGDKGANRERVDQSKKRAFYTIMGIMAVLLLSFGANVVASMVYSSVDFDELCLVMMGAYWFDLPSSLVLPLLFLHRAGKLQCCKQNTES